MIRHAPSIGLGIGLSLRSDVLGVGFTGLLDLYGGAKAAYSLRALSRGWLAGDVVEVRRSSDSATQAFTASQVTNGDLVTFVETDNTFYTSDFSSNMDGWGTSSCITTPNVDEDADGAGQPPSDNWLRIFANDRISIANNATVENEIKSLGGGTYKIDVDYYAPVTLSNHKCIVFSDAGIKTSNSITFNAGGGTRTYTITITDAQASGLTDFRIGSTNNYTTGTLLYLKNIRIRKTDGDGYVSTWYDQSGNANNATQATTTSQPKIVDAGSLLVDTNGLPKMTLDGIDDSMDYNSSGFDIGDASTYTVCRHATVSNNDCAFAPSGSASNRRWYSIFTTAGGFKFGYGSSSSAISAGTDDTVQHLFALNAGSTVEGFKDGVSQGTVAVSSGLSAQSKEIGTINGGSLWSGDISELIIYNSDQVSSVAGINSNITSHYSL